MKNMGNPGADSIISVKGILDNSLLFLDWLEERAMERCWRLTIHLCRSWVWRVVVEEGMLLRIKRPLIIRGCSPLLFCLIN